MKAKNIRLYFVRELFNQTVSFSHVLASNASRGHLVKTGYRKISIFSLYLRTLTEQLNTGSSIHAWFKMTVCDLLSLIRRKELEIFSSAGLPVGVEVNSLFQH